MTDVVLIVYVLVIAVIVHLLYIHHTIWYAITLSKEIANSNKHQAIAVREEGSFLTEGMAREIM